MTSEKLAFIVAAVLILWTLLIIGRFLLWSFLRLISKIAFYLIFRKPKILTAAFEGDIATVKALLNKGIDVNARDRYARTALMEAAAKGYSKIVEFLLLKGADVNAKQKNGYTALMGAAYEAYPNIAIMLIDNGADINAKNEDGLTALSLSLIGDYKQSLQTASVLLENGGNVDERTVEDDITPLMRAASTGRTNVLNFLLSKGANVSAIDAGGRSVLMHAVFGKRSEIVREILNKGADPNTKDKCGATALMLAVGEAYSNAYKEYTRDSTSIWEHLMKAYENIVIALLDKGADVNLKDERGLTAMKIAAKAKREHIVDLLKQAVATG